MALGAFFALLLFGYVAAPAVLALSDKPTLAIPIPNLRLTSIEAANKDADKTAVQYLGAPWIAQYVSGVYNYISGAAVIIGGVMFVVGGFQYMTAGADANRVKEAKERITFISFQLIDPRGKAIVDE